MENKQAFLGAGGDLLPLTPYKGRNLQIDSLKFGGDGNALSPKTITVFRDGERFPLPILAVKIFGWILTLHLNSANSTSTSFRQI